MEHDGDNSDDDDVIKEENDDKHYMKDVRSEHLQEIVKNASALSDQDIKNLIAQHGLKIFITELKELKYGFENLKYDKWYLVYCNGNKNKPAHWISIIKTIDNEEDLLLVFDSFGRHLEDIFNDHNVDEEIEFEPAENFLTLTENWQGPISQVCGYYQCVFAFLFQKTKHNIGSFQKILNSLLTEVDDDDTPSDDLGVITFNNDKTIVYMFSKFFDYSSLNTTIHQLIEVSHQHQNVLF